MIASILSIIAFLLPLIWDRFGSKEAAAGRSNEDFDKAIAANDTAAITRMLSERYDSVRAKSPGSAR